MTQPIRLGTRGSQLALTQSRWVAAQIEQLGYAVTLEIIRTTGDRLAETPVEQLPGKGVFVKEIEQALLDGAVDLAVHSLKDLPGESTPGLVIAAVPPREDPRDALIGPPGKAVSLAALPAGSRVGTSSLRRRAQLLALRADLTMDEMRGNVDTRLRKLDAGQYEAICLAAAGLRRLGLADRITEYLDVTQVTPAPGQGALALQTRADDGLRALLAPLHHAPTDRAVRLERTVLAVLGGGCSLPLGVLAREEDGAFTILVALGLEDGRIIRRTLTASGDPEALGAQIAESLRGYQ